MMIVLVCALPFLFVAILVSVVVRAIGRRSGEMKLSRDEEAQFQQLWGTAEKMEDRLANLETILMSRARAPEEEKIPEP
jgi:phage shock protein B